MFHSDIQRSKIGDVNARPSGVKVQTHWESGGRFSESFQGLLPFFFFSPPLSGIFTLVRAAPGAIHYGVKVLVLLSGLEA